MTAGPADHDDPGLEPGAAGDAEDDTLRMISFQTGVSATVRLAPGDGPEVMTLELTGPAESILEALRRLMSVWPEEGPAVEDQEDQEGDG
jgi:hypothetical protein